MCERDIRVGLKRLPKGLWSTDNSLLSLKDLGFSLLGLVLACLIFSCFFFLFYPFGVGIFIYAIAY